MNFSFRSPRLFSLPRTTNRNLALVFLLLLALLSSFFVAPAGVAVSGEGVRSEALRAGIVAEQPQQIAPPCPTCAPPTPQVIYAPLFDVPEASGSEIVLNCRSSHEIEVTPTFYTIEGKPIIGDVIRLQPAEIRFVDTKSLIPVRERNRHRWGGIALSYTGNLMEGWAQLTLKDIHGGGSSNVLFAVVNLPRANTIDAVWESPRHGEALIALGNSSDQPIHANLIFSNGESQQADVAPFATEIVRRHSEDWSPSDDGRVGAVSINYTGPAGRLIPTGFVSSANGKFTSSIRFYNTPNIVQPNLYGNNLRLKGNVSHMVLRNTSSDFLTARPRFLTATGTAADMVKLPALTLKPNEAAEVDLRPLSSAAANRADLDSVSVQVLNNGAPGSLIGALYSQNKTTGLTYDVPLRDSGPPRASTGGYPVRLDGDYTTMLSITNVGAKSGQFTLQVNYEGGKYELGLITFSPGETKTYDIRKLRDDQTPDRNGHPFPRLMATGQVRWSMRGNGSVPLFGRVEVVSLNDGVSSSYSCVMCCPNTFHDGSIDPDYSSIYVGDTLQHVAKERQHDCYNNLYGPYDVAADWSSNNSDVATIDYDGLVTAVSPGAVGFYATWPHDTWFSTPDMCIYDQGSNTANNGMQVSCAVPTNFHQVGNGTDNNGVLKFHYEFDSSTGNLSNLSQCTMGELVTYPGGDPYVWPMPPFDKSNRNPVVRDVTATGGAVDDQHKGPDGWILSYQAASFTATQYYRYKCPCSNNGQYVNVLGPLNIARSVTQNQDGTWKYTVTKSGYSATINPLP